jgi:uncharacterized protein
MGVRGVFASAAASVLLFAAMPAIAQFSDGYSFLKALKDGDGAKALEFVNKPGSPALSAKESGTGESALHIVIRRHDIAWLNFLLARGAQTELRDRDGNTPLHLAAQLDEVEAIGPLLQSGAQANAANTRGETALIISVHQRSLPAARLLIAGGANPALSDRIAGKSAMDYAREDTRGGTAMVRLLETAKPAATRPVAGPVR